MKFPDFTDGQCTREQIEILKWMENGEATDARTWLMNRALLPFNVDNKDFACLLRELPIANPVLIRSFCTLFLFVYREIESGKKKKLIFVKFC